RFPFSLFTMLPGHGVVAPLSIFTFPVFQSHRFTCSVRPLISVTSLYFLYFGFSSLATRPLSVVHSTHQIRARTRPLPIPLTSFPKSDVDEAIRLLDKSFSEVRQAKTL